MSPLLLLHPVPGSSTREAGGMHHTIPDTSVLMQGTGLALAFWGPLTSSTTYFIGPPLDGREKTNILEFVSCNSIFFPWGVEIMMQFNPLHSHP